MLSTAPALAGAAAFSRSRQLGIVPLTLPCRGFRFFLWCPLLVKRQPWLPR
jgi:hypothetical protein